MTKEMETIDLWIGSIMGGVEGRRNHVIIFQIKYFKMLRANTYPHRKLRITLRCLYFRF